jgi:hypothetical protein
VLDIIYVMRRDKKKVGLNNDRPEKPEEEKK